MARASYPRTPDGRYFVAKGRLWRCTDPSLPEDERRAAVKALMRARNAVRLAKRDGAGEEDGAMRAARAAVNEAKVALGERGPVWWTDGAEPQDRLSPANSTYSEWWASLGEDERAAGV